MNRYIPMWGWKQALLSIDMVKLLFDIEIYNGSELDIHGMYIKVF